MKDRSEDYHSKDSFKNNSSEDKDQFFKTWELNKIWILNSFFLVLFLFLVGLSAYLLGYVLWEDFKQVVSIHIEIIRHALLVLVLLAIISGIVKIAISDGERRSKKWIADLITADRTDNLKFSELNRVLPELECRIEEQLGIIRCRANHHFEIMTYFYVRYYMSITTFSMTAVLAAVALIFISRHGWDQISSFVITSFVVLTGSSAFFGAFPSVFRQNQNIADNKALYLRLINLEQEVLSFAATGENLKGDKIEAAKFIHYIDRQMADFNNIAVGFDETKIPNYATAFSMQKATDK